MKVASLADVKARLSAYIEELPTKGPVVITRNGKTAAVLIAPEDDELKTREHRTSRVSISSDHIPADQTIMQSVKARSAQDSPPAHPRATNPDARCSGSAPR